MQEKQSMAWQGRMWDEDYEQKMISQNEYFILSVIPLTRQDFALDGLMGT
jgi:hypothetical protein